MASPNAGGFSSSAKKSSPTTTSAATLMLQKEFQTLKRFPVSEDYCVHEFHEDNIMLEYYNKRIDSPTSCLGHHASKQLTANNAKEWIVFLFGPEGTAFEGATFKALMRFPHEYPHSPPSLQFLSEIYHPNVFRDGKLCISTLQGPHPGANVEESKLNWSAALGASGALQSVVSLLADPNPDDPANPEAARMFTSKRAEFNNRARECSKKSKQDVPQDFVRPVMLSSPGPERNRDVPFVQAFKHHKSSSEDDDDDDDYTYDTDEQQELEEQLAEIAELEG